MAQDGRNPDPVSPSSDVFSDDHAVEHPEQPLSSQSAISHHISEHALNPHTAPVRSRRSSPIRSSSRRSLASRLAYQNSDVQDASHHGPSLQGPDVSDNDAQHVSNDLNNHKDARPRRGGSNASSSFIPRSQSPYNGATGPSQPYGMYPQGTQSRTPSTATSINPRLSRRSVQASSGPAQPYGLYPQNTVPEDEAQFGHQQTIPIGFPGHSQGHTYLRRLGPEGEDADDMIGPLGHTEPLPPYTRYANDLPPKEGMPHDDIDTTPSPSNPPQHSEETIAPAQSDESTERGLVSPESPTLVDPHATPPSEAQGNGGHFKEKITERGKRRVCGTRVPLWLLLIVVALLAATIIMGGVLGDRARNQGPPNRSPSGHPPQAATTIFATVTSTTLIDAVPITSTPSNLPPLPTGSYTLNLADPEPSSSDCLYNHPEQMVAWACSDEATLALDVVANDGGYQVAASNQAAPDSPVRYGPQPPQLSGPASLMLMNDRDDWNKGPAYFFQRKFDKVVVVREDRLHGPASTQKRWWDVYSHNGPITPIAERTDSEDDELVNPTDRPWYCFWNATILEGFLYINQSVTEDSDSSMDDSEPSTSPGVDSAYPSIPSNLAAPSSAYPSSVMRKRSQVDPPNYSKVVKIEERRQPDVSKPYCQQFQMLANGALGSLTYPNSQNLIKIMLDEDEPTQQKSVQSRKRALSTDQNKRAKREQDSSGQGCQCQWVVD